MTVQKYQPAATGAGRIAEASMSATARSMAAEGSPIKYGKAVKLGTDKEIQVKAWDGAASTDIFAGIALNSVTGDLDNDQYLQGNPVSVLKKGTVWVKVSADSAGVTAGQKAAVLEDGDFTAAPLSVDTNGVYGVELEGSEYLTSAAAGELVMLAINLPSTTKVVQL
ncbi:hypothetical protein Amet_4362 [Alkaliphilus metalliredigens QYMF]|uniref:Uncharacterized protein n=1 Tax=Alkaliphilus metalliredigens (strain QYMF) TaxID=293826 RepID=A6TKC9_ALKMQ|nr:hypothetical protein [Alkaliphilus metalliredigens]ABR46647.1 hypothetical protein Amet_0419 [Alkaliphilus metalliredigens QYMF]ABR48119.1 hypothetical protein Amet_1956 [Alkaliphilus metalliredigens QYMF]ABR50436.1 hypothetical protein Amet_4362 [Alkaliphilus metalliredigens QYMF]